MMTNKPTFGSYLSGMGMMEAGAQDAGFEPVFGVEFDPGNPDVSGKIADMHEVNFPNAAMYREDVATIDPAKLPRVDWFHASPVCKEFSNAKTSGEETAVDIAVAEGVVRYILHHRPEWVTIENVWGYRKSQSWNTIYQAISGLYGIRVMKVNSADYGVPQTRVRMIVLAHLNSPAPARLRPTHMETPPTVPTLFDVSLPKWIGWYEAIEDLLPDLPLAQRPRNQACDHDPEGRPCAESPYCRGHFADWQVERLPEELKECLLLKAANTGANEKRIYREEAQPSKTVTSFDGSGIRALLVDGKLGSYSTNMTTSSSLSPLETVTTSHNSRDIRAYFVPGGNAASFSIRTQDEPARTIGDTERVGNHPRAMLPGYRIVKMTPRALARFQSLPDWYQLSGVTSVDTTAIGNGVPSRLAERIGRHILAETTP